MNGPVLVGGIGVFRPRRSERRRGVPSASLVVSSNPYSNICMAHLAEKDFGHRAGIEIARICAQEKTTDAEIESDAGLGTRVDGFEKGCRVKIRELARRRWRAEHVRDQAGRQQREFF